MTTCDNISQFTFNCRESQTFRSNFIQSIIHPQIFPTKRLTRNLQQALLAFLLKAPEKIPNIRKMLWESRQSNQFQQCDKQLQLLPICVENPGLLGILRH